MFPENQKNMKILIENSMSKETKRKFTLKPE